MSIPKPKQEISIKNLSYLLWITVHSNDANEWIETEAPKFGTFHKATVEKHHTLWIADGYDANEVEAYLLSYQQPEDPETDSQQAESRG